MILTIAIAALAVCGVFLIAWTICAALLMPLPEESTYYVVYLRGDAGQVQQTVRSCLRLRERRGLQAGLIFVDGGLDAEGQTAAELLLRRQSGVTLCAPSQLQEIFQRENEKVGAGTH